MAYDFSYVSDHEVVFNHVSALVPCSLDLLWNQHKNLGSQFTLRTLKYCFHIRYLHKFKLSIPVCNILHLYITLNKGGCGSLYNCTPSLSPPHCPSQLKINLNLNWLNPVPLNLCSINMVPGQVWCFPAELVEKVERI